MNLESADRVIFCNEICDALISKLSEAGAEIDVRVIHGPSTHATYRSCTVTLIASVYGHKCHFCIFKQSHTASAELSATVQHMSGCFLKWINSEESVDAAVTTHISAIINRINYLSYYSKGRAG